MAEFVGKNYNTVLKNEVEITLENMTHIFENHKVFAFGYGSLLYVNGWFGRGQHNMPSSSDMKEAEIKRYERGPWGLYGDTNFYGVICNSRKSFNGVLVHIPTLREWVNLMSTEMIVGLYQWANYRVVDVTDCVSTKAKLPRKAIVHMVCNRPDNRIKMLDTRPSPGYYDRVWRGVRRERSRAFADRFLETGGFQSNRAVRAYLHEIWKKRGPEERTRKSLEV